MFLTKVLKNQPTSFFYFILAHFGYEYYDVTKLFPLDEYLWTKQPNNHKALKFLQQANAKGCWSFYDNNLYNRACNLGLIELALHLLSDPKVQALNALQGNLGFLNACRKRSCKSALLLIKNPIIRNLASINNNLALHYACERENDALVLQLLTIPKVRALASMHNNEALFYLFNKGYEKAALKLMHEPQVSSALKENYELNLSQACRRGFGKLALFLLKYQRPLYLNNKLMLRDFENTIDNDLNKVTLILLQNPKLARLLEPADYSRIDWEIHFTYNKKIASKIMLHPKVSDVFSIARFVDICHRKWSKLALTLLNRAKVRTNLEYFALFCFDAAIVNKLDKVVIKLLSHPEFAEHAAYQENHLLSQACKHNMLNLALRLLEIDQVKECLVSHFSIEFANLELEIEHPNNKLIFYLSNCKKHMRPVLQRILEIRQLAGISELPGFIEYSQRYFVLACNLGLKNLAEKIWQNLVARAKLSSYKYFYLATAGGLMSLAIKMLEIPAISVEAANYNNFILHVAIFRNHSGLTLQLLNLEVVQANVVTHQRLLLLLACKFDLKNDMVIKKLLQYSNLSECLESNYLNDPITKTILPHSTQFKDDIQSASLMQGLELDAMNILNKIKDELFSINGKKAYNNLNLVMAFQSLAMPWPIAENNYNNKLALKHNQQLTAFQQKLSENNKSELITFLWKTKRALLCHFPSLSKLPNALPDDLLYQIFSYDRGRNLMHLRYAAQQLYKNPNLRTRLANM